MKIQPGTSHKVERFECSPDFVGRWLAQGFEELGKAVSEAFAGAAPTRSSAAVKQLQLVAPAGADCRVRQVPIEVALKVGEWMEPRDFILFCRVTYSRAFPNPKAEAVIASLKAGIEIGRSLGTLGVPKSLEMWTWRGILSVVPDALKAVAHEQQTKEIVDIALGREPGSFYCVAQHLRTFEMQLRAVERACEAELAVP